MYCYQHKIVVYYNKDQEQFMILEEHNQEKKEKMIKIKINKKNQMQWNWMI